MAIMSVVKIWLLLLAIVILVPYGRGFPTDPGPCHPCHALYTDDFMQKCGNILEDKMMLMPAFRLPCQVHHNSNSLPAIEGLLTSLENLCLSKNMTVALDIPDCKEVDLVFMVQVSNQVGAKIVSFFKSFLTSTLNHDNLKEFISDESIDIGIMSFSDVVLKPVILDLNNPVNAGELEENVQDIKLVAGITQTQNAIAEFTNQLSRKSISENDRRQVGVLLSFGNSTNWRATVLSMRDLYEKHPKVKVIVVNLFKSQASLECTGEIRAMATGDEDDNTIPIAVSSSLDGVLAGQVDSLVDMILAEHEPEECSQLLVMNIAGEDMKCHEGVYEKTTPCDATHTTYMHTNGQYWMASIDLKNSFRLWMITFGRPDDDCKLQPATKVIAWVGTGVQDEADLLEASWIMVSTHYPEIEVACFN